MRTRARLSRVRVVLTPEQRALILSTADQLPPYKRHGFVVRVEGGPVTQIDPRSGRPIKSETTVRWVRVTESEVGAARGP